MWGWIVRNKFVILAGLVGIALGWLGNYLANKASEKRIIDAITAEIESLRNKRLGAEEQKRLIELEAQLKLLTT